SLEVRKDLDSFSIPAVLHQLKFHELTGREEFRHAAFVRFEPLVNIRFRSQSDGLHRVVVAVLADDLEESPVVAGVAGIALANQVVTWAEELEIVEVI